MVAPAPGRYAGAVRARAPGARRTHANLADMDSEGIRHASSTRGVGLVFAAIDDRCSLVRVLSCYGTTGSPRMPGRAWIVCRRRGALPLQDIDAAGHGDDARVRDVGMKTGYSRPNRSPARGRSIIRPTMPICMRRAAELDVRSRPRGPPRAPAPPWGAERVAEDTVTCSCTLISHPCEQDARMLELDRGRSCAGAFPDARGSSRAARPWDRCV